MLNFALLYILLTFFTRSERSSSSSSSSSSEMVGIDLKDSDFIFSGAFSSLTFLSISWVLRLPIRPMSSISSLSSSSFNVAALTFHDGGRVRMTFLTFCSLSIASSKKARSLVMLVNFVIVLSINLFFHSKIFILGMQEINLSSLNL